LVDGCFWHGCPDHHRAPRTNGDYWAAKIARNAERDQTVTARLEAAGWRVLRFWEHQDFAEMADSVEQAVRPPAVPAPHDDAGGSAPSPVPRAARNAPIRQVALIGKLVRPSAD
jgi:DNA mismatch endonuclease (patch repair protein)